MGSCDNLRTEIEFRRVEEDACVLFGRIFSQERGSYILNATLVRAIV
jgi:hypothetical protein